MKCSKCHRDAHRGQLDQNCLKCHSFNSWVEAREKFDHDQARFKLTGKHKEVRCDLCHGEVDESAGGRFLTFKGIKFNRCSDCHIDLHSGRFGKCERCHLTQGWKFLKSDFDHDRMTKFKLKGKHSTLNCSKCHNRVKFVRTILDYNLNYKIKHSLCLDCHEDHHGGVFSSKQGNKDCSSCHSEDGFIPVMFTVQRHNVETKFILEGAHLAIPCRGCHLTAQGEIFSWDKVLCQTCHKDRHAGQFADDSGTTRCETCHRETFWKDLAFDHSAVRFKLEGKHAEIKCERCHVDEISDGVKFVRYRGTSGDCVSCHKDIHFGQFSSDSCGRCHVPLGWRELIFEHNRDSRFKLDGAHLKVNCYECHRKEIKGKFEFTRFKPLSTRCGSCHGRK
jgi:hypothetical protein